MPVEFRYTSTFEFIRSQIENHLYQSILNFEKDYNLALNAVTKFNVSIEELCITLEGMYQNFNPNDGVGIKSFPIMTGRYRVFYKIQVQSGSHGEVIFFDIDDNKQSNLDRFPAHTTSFDDDYN
jgi:hypothetical protein